MAERVAFQQMSHDQAGDLEAVVDGLLDRIVSITGPVAGMQSVDRELSALGNAIERIVQASLQRLSAPGQLDETLAFQNVTDVAVASAAAHVSRLNGPVKAAFAVIAAQGLSKGLNGKPCECSDCQRDRARRAH